ncbi:MAG: MFS transporter [Bacteroides sp.]
MIPTNQLSRLPKSPITWVPTVYFAMGMPFVVLNMVCGLMFKGMGISDTEITFWTSLIMLPWTLKFFWSPFLEMCKTKKYFVVLTQIASGALFGLVALTLHLPHFFCYAIALMALIAISGATHDVATDGIYMSVLTKTDQAKYIGWQGAFYNLAKLFATGVLVSLAGVLIDWVGVVNAWSIVMLSCCALLVLLGLYHMRMLPSGGTAVAEVKSFADTVQTLKEVIRSFFAKKYIAWYIAFIILYRFAEGFVIKIVPLFLKASVAEGGLGLTETQIGFYYGSFGAVAFVLGSFLAGYFIAGRGLKKTLFTLCCVFNIPFAVYPLLAIYQPDSMLLVGSAIAFEYFGYGFGFVGLTLFMMQQVAPGKHQMAHYAFASGIMNLGVMIPGMMSGYLSQALGGYRMFFLYVLLAAIPAFIITWLVPFTYKDEKK